MPRKPGSINCVVTDGGSSILKTRSGKNITKTDIEALSAASTLLAPMLTIIGALATKYFSPKVELMGELARDRWHKKQI